MTPKEKAEQLVWKYSRALQIWDEENSLKAIQCALIAVEELLRSHHNLYGVNNKQVKFYSEVQQEIEKL
jgi:hypothetical protein